MFLLICDTEKGDFRMLPFEGCLMDQPRISMQILGVIQSTYREVMSEKVKKMTAKAGQRSGQPSRTRRPR